MGALQTLDPASDDANDMRRVVSVVPTPIASTRRTIVAADLGQRLVFNNALDTYIFVPTGLPTNFGCEIVNAGTGKIIVYGDATINAKSGYTQVSIIYAQANIVAIGTDSYIVVGGDAVPAWSPILQGSALVDFWLGTSLSATPVAAWQGSNGALTLRADGGDAYSQAQASPSWTTPTTVTFNGSQNALTAGAPYTFVDQLTLPDGLASSTGKGFTCTGMTLMPDGTWFFCNYGKALNTDVGALTPSIVHVAADRTTKLSEWPLSAVAGAIQDVQGLVYDPVLDLLWFASLTDSKIYGISATTGALVRTLSPGYVVNGLAYDSTLDLLIACRVGSPVNWIDKVTGTTITKTVKLEPQGCDHAFFDPSEGAEGTLWITFGQNLVPGKMAKYDVASQVALQMWHVTEATSIEGIVKVGSTIYLANDGRYHTDYLDTNRTIKLTVDPTTPVLGTTVVMAGVVQAGATPASTTAVFVGGDPVGIYGLGLFLVSGSTTTLRLIGQQTTGGQKQVNWTVPGGVTTEFLFYMVMDTAANTASLYVNGALVSTQSAVGLTAPFKSLVWTAGCSYELAPTRFANMTAKGLLATRSNADRQKVEGFLAWSTGTQALLPGGHPYASAAP